MKVQTHAQHGQVPPLPKNAVHRARGRLSRFMGWSSFSQSRRQVLSSLTGQRIAVGDDGNSESEDSLIAGCSATSGAK